MPGNKNAVTRFALLDKLLSDRYHNWSIQDMTDYLGEHLPDYGQEPVSKRMVELDLKYLEEDSPFQVEFERYKIDAPQKNGTCIYKKPCIRYADPNYRIFQKKLSEEERSLLASVLSTLGSFKGQPNFEWLESLADKLKIKEQPCVISMSKNLNENSTLLAELFNAIKNKAVVKLTYYTFTEASQTKSIEVSPYHIKEYNNRWFLLASPFDSDRILTFALDRIISLNYECTNKFKLPPVDYLERYEDIIGITYYEDKPTERIIFWVSDNSKGYVDTKPIHGSQKSCRKDEQQLRDTYPSLQGGAFYSIECIENYELIRELTSFGADLIVLSPPNIVNEIKSRITQMTDIYKKI